jgi:hypothetical protein
MTEKHIKTLEELNAFIKANGVIVVDFHAT